MLNLNILASSTGTDKVVSGTGTELLAPKIVIVKRGDAASVDLLANGETIYGGDGSSIKVYGMDNNGTMGKAYVAGAAASATEWVYDNSTGYLTLPTDTSADAPDKFIIKYERYSPAAVKISNNTDKFPGTIKLTLKALAIDPCSPDTLRACYIVIPSFQVSPEVSITVNTEGTLDYKGDMQVAYCSSDKELYSIFMVETDEEE